MTTEGTEDTVITVALEAMAEATEATITATEVMVGEVSEN